MNKIYRLLIMLHCLWIVGWRCLAVAVYARFNSNNRQFTTDYLHKGGVTILKSVKASYAKSVSKVFKEKDIKLKIYVSNHLSLYDLPLIVATIPDSVRVVIKKELLKVPVLGKAAIASEQIIVDRKNKSNNKAFYEIAEKQIKSGISVWGFPEGTRSRAGEMLPFKLGIFKLAQEVGAYIIPVGIIGTDKILAADYFLPNLHKDLEIKVGDPIAAFDYPLHEVQKLADDARAQILNLIKR